MLRLALVLSESVFTFRSFSHNVPRNYSSPVASQPGEGRRLGERSGRAPLTIHLPWRDLHVRKNKSI